MKMARIAYLRKLNPQKNFPLYSTCMHQAGDIEGIELE